MKILITGGSSLLGKALLETSQGEHDIESTWYTNYGYKPMYQMDVANRSQVNYIFDRIRPDIVIHCAGNGSVDYAQNNYSEAYEVNVKGTRNVLKATRDHDAKMVYLSTNAVFSGKDAPYAEDGERRPVNMYGSLKRQAEDWIRDSRHWIIIRPHLLYGWAWPSGRSNWAMFAAMQLAQGKRLKVVADKITHPLYVVDCAETIWKLLETDNEIFNVAGENKVSLYEFTQMVAKVWDFDLDLIDPVSSDTFENLAPRPDDTSYDLSKIYSLGIRPRGVKEGLNHMKTAWEQGASNEL